MKKTKLNGNSVLLLITIVLFFVMYLGGCIIYSGKGFAHMQTFLNILINNAGLICVASGMTCVMLTGGIDAPLCQNPLYLPDKNADPDNRIFYTARCRCESHPPSNPVRKSSHHSV